MATNRIQKPGDTMSVVCSHPTTPASGNPVRFGVFTGVALIDEGDSITNETTVDFGLAVWDISSKGVNDAGNSAIAAGDALYYVDADINDGTGFLSKKDSGYFFGIALEAVTGGSTDTINVLHVPATGPGAAQLADIVNTAAIEDDAVTKAKLAGSFLAVELVAGQNEGADNTYTMTKGIAVGDELVFVGHISTAAAIATLADVTSDFSVTGTNEISGDGATDRTSDQLMVIYLDLT